MLPPVGGFLHHEIDRGPEGSDWLVFMHGAGGSMHTFKRQFPHFSGRFHLLKLDLRDHGDSKNLPIPEDFDMYTVSKDVITLLDHLGIASAHFMGVSMGSIFVRLVDELHPAVVRSVVVGGGVFKLSLTIQLFIRSGVLLAKVMPFQTLYRLLATIIMPAKNHRKSREIFIREAEKISQQEFDRWLRLTPELRGQLKRHFEAPISGPTLVVMGDEDHVFLGPAHAYAARWPGVDIAVIPRCGHVCNIEKPDDFNRVVDTWFHDRFGIVPAAPDRGASPL